MFATGALAKLCTTSVIAPWLGQWEWSPGSVMSPSLLASSVRQSTSTKTSLRCGSAPAAARSKSSVPSPSPFRPCCSHTSSSESPSASPEAEIVLTSKHIFTASPPVPSAQLCGQAASPDHFASPRLTLRLSVSEPVGLMSTWSSAFCKKPGSVQNGSSQSSLSHSSIDTLTVGFASSTVCVNDHGGFSGMSNGKMKPTPNSNPKSSRSPKLFCWVPPIVTPA